MSGNRFLRFFGSPLGLVGLAGLLTYNLLNSDRLNQGWWLVFAIVVIVGLLVRAAFDYRSERRENADNQSAGGDQ